MPLFSLVLVCVVGAALAHTPRFPNTPECPSEGSEYACCGESGCDPADNPTFCVKAGCLGGSGCCDSFEDTNNRCGECFMFDHGKTVDHDCKSTYDSYCIAYDPAEPSPPSPPPPPPSPTARPPATPDPTSSPTISSGDADTDADAGLSVVSIVGILLGSLTALLVLYMVFWPSRADNAAPETTGAAWGTGGTSLHRASL